MSETAVRDRIVGLRRCKASELRKNPKNWRAHPEAQKSALRAMLEDIGLVGAAIGRETPDGVELIDGHLRADMLGDQEIPVLIVDLDDAEAGRALLTYDPVGDLASINPENLKELAAGFDLDALDNAELRRMMADIFDQVADEEDRQKEAGGEKEVPGMALQPHEHYDYIVVLATTSQEFNVLCEKLALTPLRRRKRMGTCRAVRASELLKVMR